MAIVTEKKEGFERRRKFKMIREIENWGSGEVGDMYRECSKFCDPNDL